MNRLYLFTGYLAGFFMVCIFAVTMLQIAGRTVGYNIRGLTDYAGYFMAGSVFLAFAYTLNQGGHVKIALFLTMMGPFRPLIEKLAYLVTMVIALWFAYYACAMVCWSYVLGDISQGQDATPMWIPQIAMAIGAIVLAIAVIDHGLRLLVLGHDDIVAGPDAM